MAKRDSVQKKLQKVRPPRVQMTYDVDVGDAVEQKELPFVVGVVGEFGGQSTNAQTKLKDKKFVAIDNDNFDDVLKGIQPKVNFHVPNKLTRDGGQLAVELSFNAMSDFSPEAIVQQVEPLRKLLEARAKLADLRNKLAGSDKLEDILNDVFTNTEKLASLTQQSDK